MKKILFLLFAIFISINTVKANTWQEEVLEGEEIETEYRYLFYKDKKEGEYVRKGQDTNYQYEDVNNVKYGNYSKYKSSCPTDEGYEIEYATKYVYQEILPVLYIKVNNLSEENLTVKNISFKEKENLISYKYQSCNLCTSDKMTIYPGGTLLIKLEYSARLIALDFVLEFNEIEKESLYELVYSANSLFTAGSLVALVQGNTKTINYKYNSNFYLYPNYSSVYVGYNIKENNLLKINSKEEVCRTREIMTYQYNIIKDYYDNNYYKDISELDLSLEEQKNYKKDLENYKIFYRNKDDNNNIITNLVNNKDNKNYVIPVKTGIYDNKINYNYLILFITSLAIIILILIKYFKNNVV